MQTKVYRAETSFTNGKCFIVAVLAQTKTDAKIDMYTAIQEATNVPFGMIRIHNLRKSNRRILSNLQAVKNCTTHKEDGTVEQWAWIG